MNVKYIISAAAGAVAGFVGGYFFCSKRKEDYIHREIQDALKVAADHMEKTGRPNPEIPRGEILGKQPEADSICKIPVSNKERSETLDDYLKRIHAEDYIQPEDMEQLPDNYINARGENKQEEMERRTNAKPGRIAKEDFGQAPDHELVGFTLYSDGALCDDADEPVTDAENTIGCTIADLIDMFKIEEEKVLYFRNERTQLDIEITEDLRKYADILEDKPYLKE